MGQTRIAATPASRPALRQRLSLRSHLSGLTLIFLPSRAPELNPVENVWQYLRSNWLSNRVFESYEAIIEAACEAWRHLLAQPQTITSIGLRDWAHVGQS